MLFFTTFFKQVFSKKDRKNPSLAPCKASVGKKLRGASSFSSKANSVAETESISSMRQGSTREGHTFKYNEEGRRYHGNDEVAYILPNDDDGKSVISEPPS
jgi:hypothetical protein